MAELLADGLKNQQTPTPSCCGDGEEPRVSLLRVGTGPDVAGLFLNQDETV